MSQLFYDHLIVIEEVLFALDLHNLTKKEKANILSLVDQTMHHHILDTILTNLPKQHHTEFLEKFSSHPYDHRLLEYLKEKSAVDMEKKIFETVNTVKKIIIMEIEKNRNEK